MPLFGAHKSIAGGLHNAMIAAQELGCQAVQLFTKSFPNRNLQKPIGFDPAANGSYNVRVGLEPFRLLVNDPRFRRHPMVLETPKEELNGRDMDVVNLKVLRVSSLSSIDLFCSTA
jgi:endonuclease IV